MVWYKNLWEGVKKILEVRIASRNPEFICLLIFLHFPLKHCSDKKFLSSNIYISASSNNIGQIAGSLLGGYCGGRFGAKKTILASYVPGALGWLTITFSPHMATLILGRVLCGLSVGLNTPNAPMLIAQLTR